MDSIHQAFELYIKDGRRIPYDEQAKSSQFRKELARSAPQPRTDTLEDEEEHTMEDKRPQRGADLNYEVRQENIQIDNREMKNEKAGRKRQKRRKKRKSTPRGEKYYAFNAAAYISSPLSSDDKLRLSSRFEIGKVFKVLWSNPKDSTVMETTCDQKPKVGEKVFHGVRRFVVVDQRKPGHVICLPILTYDGGATTKKGVHRDEHGMIYTGKASSTGGYEKMTKKRIRVLPEFPSHRQPGLRREAEKAGKSRRASRQKILQGFFQRNNRLDATSALKLDAKIERSSQDCHQQYTRYSVPSNDFLVKQKGLKVLVNNRKESAFGDTGAGQNVISDRRRQELELEMCPHPTSFPMGNSQRIFSPGTVEVPLAFEDDPKNVMTIIAHVVQTFAYDLLLGNPFLQATKCLTSFKHRFVQCMFLVNSRWSFNLLGETTHRFQGHLGKDLPFLGLPDIGSTRNVMDAMWAEERGKAAGFEILSRPENCGLILFPDGTEEATVGQVHTTTTLSDGTVVPIVFELLPHCHVPVVLGQDFIFDHDIYTKYSESILEINDLDSGDELMPMHFRRHIFEAKNSGSCAGLSTVRQKDDLEQHLDWDLKHEYGRTASVEEWNLEYERRERYERSRNPNWQLDTRIPLIEKQPKRPLLPTGRNDRPEEGSDTSSSFQRGESTLTNSSTSSTDNTSKDPTVRWGHDPYFSDSFVSEEAAQWQAERPS